MFPRPEGRGSLRYRNSLRYMAVAYMRLIMLGLTFFSAPSLRAQHDANAATERRVVALAQHRKPFKILLTGDSTVAPNGGWGDAFCALTAPNVTCVNLAKGGRSTKSYIDEGWWQKALDEHGQYVFFQFGHNDQKPAPAVHADADGAYADNLRRFIRDVRAQGGVPIVVTSLSRRNYRDGKLIEADGLSDYAAAAKRVATEERVTVVDLLSLSRHLLEGETQAEADTFNAVYHTDATAENGAAAKPDRTHLNGKGAAVFSRMVAESLVRSRSEFAPDLDLTLRAVSTSTTTLQVGPTEAFHTLQAAVDAAPATGATIRIAPGTYREKVHITTPHLVLVGTGKSPSDVVLSWNDAAKNAGGTFKSGSVSVDADGFKAENLTIENTWENEHQRTEEGSQAVALLMSSDRAVLDNVRLVGAQDTLYANSRTCHDNLPKDGTAPQGPQPVCRASRQYFRDVYIEGHVDYIFGDAQAVFDHCDLHPRNHATVMFTAQSRHYPEEVSGYYFLHSRITGDASALASDKLVLGRPWRDYSTVWFYDTEIGPTLFADGWSEWNGRLKTAEYREYNSHGPGVNSGHRIVDSPPLTKEQEKGLTPRALLRGTDAWDPVKEADGLRRLR